MTLLGIFNRNALPKKIPTELQVIINQLKGKSRIDILKGAYNTVTTKFTSSNWKTYTHLPEIFQKNTNKLWTKGFLYCTHQNFLIRLILIKTGKFKESDIKLRRGLTHWLSPHQWLSVRIRNKWIDVDPWGRSYGVPFGKNAHGFTSTFHRKFIKKL
tara:strand:- start:247 stop:717 length:471 start_codon:yes stop_codon:yes gene_type:complete